MRLAFIFIAAGVLQGCDYVNVEVAGDITVDANCQPPWQVPFMGPPPPPIKGIFREGFYGAAL